MSEYSPLKGSTLYGKIVVIRRSGEDGSIFPMTVKSCVIGRSDDCSIRVVIPTVSDKQCQIQLTDDGSVEVVNLSSTSPTRVNSKSLSTSAVLNHMDLISIVDRHFRFEYPDGHPMAAEVGATLKRRSSTGKRKSKSPSKAKVAEDMAQSKVLTPSSKPPQPVFSDDIENQFPENMAASSATKCVSRRRSSFKKDMTPSKILTPKIKPPVPSAVARVMNMTVGTPGSPAPPGRRSTANLRKSLSELKQRSESIAETPDVLAPPERKSLTSAKKRKSKSPGTAAPASKRKRVSFGVNLSPELFDKKLPPGTPVRRGSAPRRVSVGAGVTNTASPITGGLLKRRSVAVLPSTKSITEESPSNKRKSKSPGAAAKPSPKQKSPASANKGTPSPARKSPKFSSGGKSKKSFTKQNRHVVVNSPHVPHHEMSEAESKLNSEQQRDEGAAFKRLSHSPESTNASPIPLNLLSESASPLLKKSTSRAASRVTPAKSSPARASPARATPAKSKPLVATPSPIKLARAIPSVRSPIARVTPRSTPNNASPVSARGSPRSPAVLTTNKAQRLAANSTPRQARNVMTPGRQHVVHTDTPRPKTPQSSKKEKDDVEKIGTPPMDLSKAVALRAIHGKAATPVLPGSVRKKPLSSPLSSKKTPVISASKKQLTSRSSTRKAVRKTWADIVKTGKRKSIGGKTKSGLPANKKAAVITKPTKRKSLTKAKAAQTPRAAMKGVAQSTGHVDSPETIVIRKGRKSVNQKSSSALAASPVNPAYDELPPTPTPPTIMFVSPMTGEKKRSRKSPLHNEASPDLTGVKEIMAEKKIKNNRKSMVLTGVNEMFNRKTRAPKSVASPKLDGIRKMMKTPRQQPSPRLTGIREMMKTPKEVKSPRYTGIREMNLTPKEVKSPRLAGVREMMTTPKEASSPQLEGVRKMMKSPKEAVSPELTGVREMMKTPIQRRTADIAAEPPAGTLSTKVKPSESQSPVRQAKPARTVAPETAVSPIKRATRGRRAAKPVEPPSESEAPKRRGRGKTETEVPEATTAKPVGRKAVKPAAPVEVESVPSPVKPRRGRPKKEADKLTDESAKPLTPVKPSRGRGRKAAEKTPEPKQVRGKKVAAQEPEPENKAPVATKRGRKAVVPDAVPSPEQKESKKRKATEPVDPPVTKKRGRAAKIANDIITDNASVTKPKRGRGRVAQLQDDAGVIDADLTPAKGSRKPSKKTDSEPETPKRRGRKPVTPVKKSPAKATTTKPRGRQAVAKPATPGEITAPVKSTRGRKAGSKKVTLQKLSPEKKPRARAVAKTAPKTPAKRGRKAATKSPEKSPAPVRKTRSRK